MAVIVQSSGAIAEITGSSQKIILSATLGNAGWSPILSLISDGNRRVLQVSGWVGGSGLPPDIGGYIGASGLVSLIANAIDIRGSEGKSAYQVAIDNGFTGTEQDWLNSLENTQWIITDW
jgi:hypothetical protein